MLFHLPYLLAPMAGFYLLPLLLRDTGGAILLLLAALPLLCLVSAFLYGRRFGFRWWLGPVVAALFVPTLWLFYDTSAWIYSIIYGVLTLLGSLLGSLPRRR